MSSLVERVYRELLNGIVNGVFRPGEPLKEDRLASLLNASRTPIREALARLERDGLVIKDGKSYRVITLTSEDILQLYEIRKPLEITSARLAAQRITEPIIKELRRTLENVRIETEKEDPNPLLLSTYHGTIHELIAKASNNKYLFEYLSEIRLKLKVVRTVLFTSYERRHEELVEHSAIVEAIINRDPELAAEKMSVHMDNVINYVRNRVIPLLFPNP